jgi:hypothetical protein
MPRMSDEPDDTDIKLAAALARIAILEDRLEQEQYTMAQVERDLDATIRNPPTPREDQQHKALLLVANKRIRAMAKRALDGIQHDQEAPTVGLVHRLCQTLSELRGPARDRRTVELEGTGATRVDDPIPRAALETMITLHVPPGHRALADAALAAMLDPPRNDGQEGFVWG